MIELGGGRRAYHLLVDDDFKHVYTTAIAIAFRGYPNRCMGWPDDVVEKRLATPVGTVAEYDPIGEWAFRRQNCNSNAPRRGIPLIIAFRDESDPSTAFKIDVEGPTTVFGKRFVFDRWEIERLETGTPLTDAIRGVLPWADPHTLWPDGRPSGSFVEVPRKLAARDASLTHKLYKRYMRTPKR